MNHPFINFISPRTNTESTISTTEELVFLYIIVICNLQKITKSTLINFIFLSIRLSTNFYKNVFLYGLSILGSVRDLSNERFLFSIRTHIINETESPRIKFFSSFFVPLELFMTGHEKISSKTSIHRGISYELLNILVTKSNITLYFCSLLS
jgi:hypothetical protein